MANKYLDPGTLLRGSPLLAAEDWIRLQGDALNEEEKAFVAASILSRDDDKVFRRGELFQNKLIFLVLLGFCFFTPLVTYITGIMPSFNNAPMPTFISLYGAGEASTETVLVTTMFVLVLGLSVGLIVYVAASATSIKLIRNISYTVILLLSLIWFINLSETDFTIKPETGYDGRIAYNPVVFAPFICVLVGVTLLAICTTFQSITRGLFAWLMALLFLASWLVYFIKPRAIGLDIQYHLWLLCFLSFGGLIGLLSALPFRSWRVRSRST